MGKRAMANAQGAHPKSTGEGNQRMHWVPIEPQRQTAEMAELRHHCVANLLVQTTSQR